MASHCAWLKGPLGSNASGTCSIGMLTKLGVAQFVFECTNKPPRKRLDSANLRLHGGATQVTRICFRGRNGCTGHHPPALIRHAGIRSLQRPCGYFKVADFEIVGFRTLPRVSAP